MKNNTEISNEIKNRTSINVQQKYNLPTDPYSGNIPTPENEMNTS
jgi:hypothetical protein